jgi:hypothetical protein
VELWRLFAPSTNPQGGGKCGLKRAEQDGQIWTRGIRVHGAVADQAIERKAPQFREFQAKRAKALAQVKHAGSASYRANELGRMDELKDKIEKHRK